MEKTEIRFGIDSDAQVDLNIQEKFVSDPSGSEA